MKVATLRIRYDRRTGEEICRKVLDPSDMPEDEYSELLVRALTGMGSESAARHIAESLGKHSGRGDEQRTINRQVSTYVHST